MIHRDLKPSNILVARDGAVKDLDFGIAAILRTDVTKPTATGSPIGTYQYIAPEQVRGGRISPQTDLYALGCLLHELLCGRVLFSADSEYMVMYQHVNAAPTPLRVLHPEVPQVLEFRCVAVIGVNEGALSYPRAVTPVEVDRVQHASDLMAERCLLFVACTRARDGLHVSWSGAPSGFLVEAGVGQNS